jgi:transcriptional regulator with XRE-family HTH domain
MENGTFLKEVGSNIRSLRKARKLTLAKMSELTKINRVSLTHLEQGHKNARILTIRAIAKSLGVDVNEILKERE